MNSIVTRGELLAALDSIREDIQHELIADARKALKLEPDMGIRDAAQHARGMPISKRVEDRVKTVADSINVGD